MRIRTQFFGMLAFMLAFGFMLASCDHSVEVRDRAAEQGVGGGRGHLVSNGITVTVTGVPNDFRHDPTPTSPVTGITAWRIVGTGNEDTLNAAPTPGRPAFPNPSTMVIPPLTAGDRAGEPTNLLGIPHIFDFVLANNNIADDGSFTLRSTTATVGDYLIRFTMSGAHVNHETTISGRNFEGRVTLDVYNRISFGSFNTTFLGTSTPSEGTGPARPSQPPDAPSSFPGVNVPSIPTPPSPPVNAQPALHGAWFHPEVGHIWTFRPNWTGYSFEGDINFYWTATSNTFTLSGTFSGSRFAVTANWEILGGYLTISNPRPADSRQMSREFAEMMSLLEGAPLAQLSDNGY